MAFDVQAFKNTFFDRAAVADQVPPAVRRALSKFGAFVRRRAQKSLVYGTGKSAPGLPPTVHRSASFTRRKRANGGVKLKPSSPLRELLFFAFDPVRQSVAIGPAIGSAPTGGPERTEHGGSGTVLHHRRRVAANWPARPFMRPAFSAELPGAADLFKGLIR